DLSDEHRPQLRRDSAAARLVPPDGDEEGGDAGELEAGRGRDHPAGGVGRRCEEDIPGWVEVAAAVHSHRPATEVTPNARLPNTNHSQLPRSQRNSQLGIGNREWLGVGDWKLGVEFESQILSQALRSPIVAVAF